MPKTNNEEYNNFIKQNEIQLVEKETLDEWLKELHKKKMPRKCSVEQAKALLICVYYTGARPSEIVELNRDSIEIKKYSTKKVYEITLTTLKGGILRSIPIPINKQTKQLYEYAKKQPPNLFIFYAFRSLCKNKVSWTISKEMLVRENGQIHNETIENKKTREYLRKGHKINSYTKQWTGKLAYFFRHHRFSYMADKGASDNEIQFFKGAKSPASVEPYKHMSIQRKEKLTRFF